MQGRRVHVRDAAASRFRAGIATIVEDLGITVEFPADVQAEADAALAQVSLPERDHTDLPFVTIDPLGAKDLDQAMHLERRGDGFTVWYAIADIGAFVRPGGAIDAEAHNRGETLFGPDRSILLHPAVLSEGAASLLPDQLRPALVWRIDLDATGEGTHVEVHRAQVRSRAQYDYASVQQQLDAGNEPEVFGLLREIGMLRQERERERGGVSLPLPEQEIVAEDGRWSLAYRAQSPVEDWNARISLLTGMAAAELMMYAEVGVLRVLPPAEPRDLARLRRTAQALRIPWPQVMDYPDFVRSLEPARPPHAAMLEACTRLLRGAGYVAFDGAVPPQPLHAAIAAPYAHCTAPMRRLVDRYVGEVCVALSEDEDVPDWVTQALPELPKTMEASDRRAHQFDRQVLDLVEAGVLSGSIGQIFGGVVTETDDKDARKGSVMVSDPAVDAPVESATPLPLGDEVRVRLVAANLDSRTVRFDLA
ncbi:MAG: RNB domain-containing ribonuclease [Nocardioidaceae bacterium]